MLPGRWATASAHHCPRFSIKEYIVPLRAHTPRPLVACCCPHRADSRAPSFSTEQPSEAVGAGGEGALQESWEGRPAPRPAPSQEQPHGAYHPAGGPALAPGGWLFLGGARHLAGAIALRGPVEWVGQLTGQARSLVSAALLRGSWSAWPEGGWSESSTLPTARAATGLTVLLPGHLPSALHSPDFSPGPFRTVETQLGILSLLCQSCRGRGRASPSPVTGTDLIYLFWFKKRKTLCVAFGLTCKLSYP